MFLSGSIKIYEAFKLLKVRHLTFLPPTQNSLSLQTQFVSSLEPQNPSNTDYLYGNNRTKQTHRRYFHMSDLHGNLWRNLERSFWIIIQIDLMFFMSCPDLWSQHSDIILITQTVITGGMTHTDTLTGLLWFFSLFSLFPLSLFQLCEGKRSENWSCCVETILYDSKTQE